MKNVIFNTLYIKNFLSIGDIPVIIDFQKGLNCITGINYDVVDSQNGVGKSSILSALIYVLYDKTNREINKTALVNNINKKTAEISVKFTVNDEKYQIVRTIKPSTCKIVKDTTDITLSTIDENNKYISDLIGMSYDIFINSVVMEANSSENFMLKKSLDKRKFIEGIFNYEIFSKILKDTVNEYNEVKKLYDIESNKLTNFKSTLDILIKQKNNVNTEKDKSIAKLNERKVENDNKIVTLLTNIYVLNEKEYNDLIGFISSITGISEFTSKEINRLNCEKAVYESGINQINKNILKLKSINSIDVCDKCNRPLLNSDKTANKLKIEELEYEIISDNKCILLINESIKNKNKELQEHTLKIKSYEQDKKAIDLKLSENKYIERTINDLKENNKSIDKDIQHIMNEKNNFDEDINKINVNINKTSEIIKKYEIDLEELNIIKHIVSDEGVKALMIKQMLDVLNITINYYLKKFEAPCQFLFNEYFDETLFNLRGVECSYWNFSSGERKRIDLAILFTFLDLQRIKGNCITNLLLFDELLDSAIDTKGIELVMEILNERIEKYGEAIYLITHKKDFFKGNINNIILLEKRHGFTIINNKGN